MRVPVGEIAARMGLASIELVPDGTGLNRTGAGWEWPRGCHSCLLKRVSSGGGGQCSTRSGPARVSRYTLCIHKVFVCA